MKLLFISDIHGSSYYGKLIEDIIQREDPDFIGVLGDILYHGARNPLPKEYDPKSVTAILNKYSDKIIAVRGNCDSEVDNMVLEFDVMADNSSILVDGRRLFLTHGHIYNEENPPKISERDVLIHGHTHLPVADKNERFYIFNPGSITLPKEDNVNSYGVYEDNRFEIKSLDGEVIKSLELK